MYIGGHDLCTLETWINGYWSACEDAGELDRLNTANGIPISLLRDYIAWKEQDRTTSGIAHILMTATGGHAGRAWSVFFSHLDEFCDLKICGSRSMIITDTMATHMTALKRFYDVAADGSLVPISYLGCIFKKTILTDDLCWVEITEGPHKNSIWKSWFSITPEKEADAYLLECFGAVNWGTEL